MRPELTAAVLRLRQQLRRSLTWDQGREMAERAFALAERLGSVNAAQELGTTWPSLRKTFTRPRAGHAGAQP